MTTEDWWDAWEDPGGPEPTDGWLTPGDGTWEWTPESLLMGEYVGYALYLKLRDRLCKLGVPTTAHDTLIQHLIDTHYASALEEGGARATLVVWDRDGPVQPIEVWSASEYPAIDQID